MSRSIGDTHVLVKSVSMREIRLNIWAKMHVVAGIVGVGADSVAAGC